MHKLNSIPKEWLALIIIAILVVLLSIFEWQKPKDTSNQKTTRLEKEEANVTIIVEYLAEKSDSQVATFQISLDTHSVNLDAFDFQKDISLEKNGKVLTPIRVNQLGSGHHRSAELTFPATNTPFTIVVKNLSQIQRREFVFERL